MSFRYVGKRGWTFVMASRKVPDMSHDVSPELKAAIEARMKELGLDPTALADLTGLSLQGLANVRRGERRGYQFRTTGPLTCVLGWSPDSIQRLLDGLPAIEVSDQPRRYHRPDVNSPRPEPAGSPPPDLTLEDRVALLELSAMQVGGELPAEAETNRDRIAVLEKRVGELTRQLSRRRGA